MIRQTAAITAASIAGVVLAGGAAVGANIGILNAGADTDLGTLSAEVPITAEAISTTTTEDSPDAQWYTADEGGDIEVMLDGATITLGTVLPNEGWSWQQLSTPAGSLSLELRSADDLLVFTANQLRNGEIAAEVVRIIDPTDDSATTAVSSGPAPTVAPAAPASAPARNPQPLAASPAPTYRDDDEYEAEYDDDDHDEYDDDEYDDDEYDDDDHDEYEEYDDHDEYEDDDDDDDDEHEGRDDDD